LRQALQAYTSGQLAIVLGESATVPATTTSSPPEQDMTSLETRRDEFRDKGAVEQESPEQDGNLNFRGQLGHRNQDPLIKANDTDYPEPGENPEHSEERTTVDLKSRDEAIPGRQDEDPEAETQDTDPGHRQRENQGDEREDPLAA
jgi:hypothetical protein